MDCMAQKVCYAADGAHTYVALIELKTKNGKPFCWVLYKHYRSPHTPVEICYNPAEISYKMQTFLIRENALNSFQSERSGCAERAEKRFWKKTTDWLHAVAVGGSYEKHPQGADVPVIAPDSFKKWLL